MSAPAEWTRIGSVSVDSGTLSLIDPCAVNAVAARWERAKKDGSFPTRPESVDSLRGAKDYGMILTGWGGDGTFDVYAKYEPPALVPEARPVITQVMIDFSGFYRKMLRELKREGTDVAGWFDENSEPVP